MYKIVFWDWDGSPSSMVGSLESAKHLASYLTECNIYWVITHEIEGNHSESRLVCQTSMEITEDCKRGWQ